MLRKMSVIMTVVTAVLFLAPIGCQSTANAPEIGNPYPGYCPVMGEKLDAEKAMYDPKLYSDYNGKRYLLCCKKCKPEFEKDPERWINNPEKPEE